MAQKELRRMNRVELIEIIYALEQNEEELKQENQELRKKLEERKVVVENAGSIAEAVAGLNHILIRHSGRQTIIWHPWRQ